MIKVELQPVLVSNGKTRIIEGYRITRIENAVTLPRCRMPSAQIGELVTEEQVQFWIDTPDDDIYVTITL